MREKMIPRLARNIRQFDKQLVMPDPLEVARAHVKGTRADVEGAMTKPATNDLSQECDGCPDFSL